MKPVPLCSAQSLARLAAFREQIGMPVPAPLSRERIRTAVLPLVTGVRLWEDTALATSDPGVALRVTTGARVVDSPLGCDAARAPTVGDGLAAAAAASSRYCSGQRVWITVAGDDVLVHRCFPPEIRRGRRQANDFALAMIIDLVRCGAGSDWRPERLLVEGPPPAHAEELAALATGTVDFRAAADTIVVPREILALPLQAPERRLPEVTPLPTDDFEGSVRRAIATLLEIGELTLPALAEVTGTSARTLQRRLALSGSNFGRLVDEARFDAARRLLQDDDISVTDVAAELGYTDSANFTRAFRRWAGVPPLGFRRALGTE